MRCCYARAGFALFACLLATMSEMTFAQADAACGNGVALLPTSSAPPVIRLSLRTIPEKIAIGEHFSVQVQMCENAPGVKIGTVRLDADMPEHRHGMNYRPTVNAKGHGVYTGHGFLFHMPGRWRFLADIEVDGKMTRFAVERVVE